eukprot:TRINITY_DN7775_c0_g1_i2.p1 TRINITY_DN7775_c0_g1~~TRINITY_DN7775_c0_g1_i2.p1  ORF type:complete len:485 (-),score=90.41 TRINITY_DN7775_c0_g1_i2:150-1604(-)
MRGTTFNSTPLCSLFVSCLVARLAPTRELGPHPSVPELFAENFLSTQSPTLDAFYQLTSTTTGQNIHKLLNKAWVADSATTLRLIFHLRSIHEGKGEKENFYRAFGWLFKHHPRTAITSLTQLVAQVCSLPQKRNAKATHGTFKDLLNIVCLSLMSDLESPSTDLGYLHQYPPWSPEGKQQLLKRRKQQARADRPLNYKNPGYIRKPQPPSSSPQGQVHADLIKAQKQLSAELGRQKHEAYLRTRRLQRRQTSYHLLETRLRDDPRFRALYITVARIFADALRADLKIFKILENVDLLPDQRFALRRRITMAAKWAPSIGASHDKNTNLATAIAALLVNQVAHPYERADTFLQRVAPHVDPVRGIDSEVAHDIRSFTRRHMISPLRELMKITERDMSANRWGDINYSRVPSLCMSINKLHFFKHDEDRFVKYLVDVLNGKKKISGGVLLPHALVKRALELIKLKETPKSFPITPDHIIEGPSYL